jgi:hypothetical protein
MKGSEVARLDAGALSVPHERQERSHLLDREAEFTASPNEYESLRGIVAVGALATGATIGPWEEAYLLVVADGRRARASAARQRTDFEGHRFSLQGS